MSKYKVKLAAIAKDESAYLPDWLFHHLYFGFDSIDVYINNTTDQSHLVAEAFTGKLPVQFLDGDAFFGESFARPQEAAYLDALQKAKQDGFSHLMFLDIDEFWTPKNFTDSVHGCIDNLAADVMSFEWLIGVSENQPFLPPYRSEIKGKKSRWVKSLFSTKLDIEQPEAHNVHAKGAVYKLANGALFNFDGRRNGRVSEEELAKPLKDYFVLHRMYRSEMEYISLLGRGRPKKSSNITSMFKDNRQGYLGPEKSITFSVAELAYLPYNNARKDFYDEYSLIPILEESKLFVKDRYLKVISMIKNAEPNDSETLLRLLKNVTLAEVINAYDFYKNKDNKRLSKKDVDLIRDSALALENDDVSLALKLMLLAKRFRPEGRVINNKIAVYRKKLNL
ncbi:glycosyltransferase family 2 protein [Agarivorans sp. MS3-6]